jgi:signal peptidase II
MSDASLKKRLVPIIAVTLLTLAADQASKRWARSSLRGRPAVVVIDGYLDLEYHENPGSAFGLLRNLPGARFILIGIGIVALVVVWRMVSRVQHRRRMGDIAFALVAGGAVGNVVDRVYIGRVVDFVLMHFHRKYIWPAYNVADVALVAGVGLLILVLGRRQEGAAPAKGKGKRGRKKK